MSVEIRPLRSESDYRSALDEMRRLWQAPEGSPEEEKLELLSLVVADYEDRHYPIPPPDPIAALHYYMESRGLTRSDLEPCFGSRGKVSEALNRKRPLTLNQIRRLVDRFGFPAEVLIRSYRLRTGTRGCRRPRGKALAGPPPTAPGAR